MIWAGQSCLVALSSPESWNKKLIVELNLKVLAEGPIALYDPVHKKPGHGTVSTSQVVISTLPGDFGLVSVLRDLMYAPRNICYCEGKVFPCNIRPGSYCGS